ncbi:MAG TPA: hypothetical protein VFZ00_01510 [Solirubrobacter sp.]|nr:hypothetical protein [Solirubrobacter sp.]
MTTATAIEEILDRLDPAEAALWRAAAGLLAAVDGHRLESVAAGLTVDVGDGLPTSASIVISSTDSEVYGKIVAAAGTRSLRIPRELLAELPETARFLPPGGCNTSAAGPCSAPAAASPVRARNEESRCEQ